MSDVELEVVGQSVVDLEVRGVLVEIGKLRRLQAVVLVYRTRSGERSFAVTFVSSV